MRAFIPICVLAASVACTSSDDMLAEDMTYSGPVTHTSLKGADQVVVDAEYERVSGRTKSVLRRWYSHLDPDKTDDESGEFWTIWMVRTGIFYRGTTRERAHVKIEEDEDGKLRIAVAVVREVNDNIENPSIVSEARWTNRHRDPEAEARLITAISQSYRRFEVSDHFKETHRKERRKTLRPDLVDKYKDVDITKMGEIDPDREFDHGTGKSWADENPEKPKDKDKDD